MRKFKFVYEDSIPLKRRPRGKAGQRSYSDPRTVAEEKLFRENFLRLYGEVRSLSDFQVTLYFRIPAATTVKQSRPRFDMDNSGKAILDALNKVLWEDDDQVTGLCMFKTFGGPQVIFEAIEMS